MTTGRLAAVSNAVIYNDSKLLHWLASSVGVSDMPLMRDIYNRFTTGTVNRGFVPVPYRAAGYNDVYVCLQLLACVFCMHEIMKEYNIFKLLCY